MGMTDSYLMHLGMADEARVTRHDSPLEAKTKELREAFASAFLEKSMSEKVDFGKRITTVDWKPTLEPATVAEIGVDAIYSFKSVEAGISVVLTCLQLCARKGDVDALRAVGTLAQAWAVENAKGLL